MQPILLALGGVLTAVASVLASWSFVLARRNERRGQEIAAHSATKEETQQAFDLQQIAMANMATDNERLRERQGQLHDTVNRVVGKLGEVTAMHTRCEEQLDSVLSRLRDAEARIHELEG